MEVETVKLSLATVLSIVNEFASYLTLIAAQPAIIVAVSTADEGQGASSCRGKRFMYILCNNSGKPLLRFDRKVFDRKKKRHARQASARRVTVRRAFSRSMRIHLWQISRTGARQRDSREKGSYRISRSLDGKSVGDGVKGTFDRQTRLFFFNPTWSVLVVFAASKKENAYLSKLQALQLCFPFSSPISPAI